MHSEVADEVSLLGELAPAQLALVGLLARVHAHVLGEPVLAGESHATLLAGEGLEAQVAAHVPRHGAALGEHLATDVAGEWPCEPVALLMLAGGGRVFVALAAHRALEGPRLAASEGGCRCGGCSREVLGLLLLLFDKGAGLFFDVELVLGVGLHVGVELLGAGEALPAGDAHVEVVPECRLEALLAVDVVGSAVATSSSFPSASSSSTCLATLPVALPALVAMLLAILPSLLLLLLLALEGLV